MRALLAAAALAVCAAAPAQELAPEYRLVSSTTAPVSKWSYSKGHISVRPLDERHVLILFACEWKNEPKATCGDYYFAQRREDGLWLQDMNTDAMRLYYNPDERTFTIISRGYDGPRSVRRDVFAAAGAPPDDPALVRRMKRQQAGADSKENLRVFGHFSKWEYSHNRIETQSNR